MIKKGSVVSFEYVLSDEGGGVLESNQGESPVTYTQGQGQIIPGLEKGMLGMETNEERELRIGPEDAYGVANPDYFQEVQKSQLPPESLEVGATLHARGPQGEEFPLRIHEIRDDSVVLDLNHPLAGKTLNFHIKVLDIQPGESA